MQDLWVGHILNDVGSFMGSIYKCNIYKKYKRFEHNTSNDNKTP